MRRKLRLITAGETMPLSGRIYPLETLQAAHRRVDVSKLKVFVHPPKVGDAPLVEELAGQVVRLYFEGQTLVAEVVLERNANGLICDMMCDKGIRWAPCGFGRVLDNIVQSDYELLYICPLADQLKETAIKTVFRQKARQNRGVKAIQSDPAGAAP